MRKKLKYFAVGMALALSLSACTQGQSPVQVVKAEELTVAATAADLFAGVVVSDNAVQIQKEEGKAIAELLVAEGDQVSEGQKLFSYNTDELNLTLDKQQLDMDRLDAEIKENADQIAVVEKELKELEKSKDENKETTKTQLNIQLRQLQTEQTQAQYDKSTLQADIDYTKRMLQNIDVYSPIGGTVRSIDETNSESYIVIQQTGSYRVKGLLNEMSMGMGIMEGVAVRVISRLNPDQVWTGVVELVDYENAEQNSYDQMYYGATGDSMTNSSSYPFYVTLDSTEGLLLGQHVYIQIAPLTEVSEMLYIPESYLMDMFSDELGTITASVWSVGEEGTLTKKIVTLGEYDINTGSYQILDGLTGEDYVADPADPNSADGAEVALPEQPTDPTAESTDPSAGGSEPVIGEENPTDPSNGDTQPADGELTGFTEPSDTAEPVTQPQQTTAPTTEATQPQQTTAPTTEATQPQESTTTPPPIPTGENEGPIVMF